MKTYYQDEFVTIIHGDAIEVLPDLSGFDFAFADPPFNVGLDYAEYRDKRPSADYYEWQEEWVKRTFDALNYAGTFYLMTISRHLAAAYQAMERHGVFINQVIWKNVAGVSSKRQYWNQYQPILAYGRTDEYYFETYAQTSDSGYRRWGGYKTEHKGQMGDIWNDIPFVYAGSIHHREAILTPGTNKKAHPAQMSEALAYRMLSFSCPHGGSAIDVFMGSGTLLRAAKDLGIKAVGIEISEQYCEIAAKRMEQPRMQFPKLPPVEDGEKPVQGELW